MTQTARKTSFPLQRRQINWQRTGEALEKIHRETKAAAQNAAALYQHRSGAEPGSRREESRQFPRHPVRVLVQLARNGRQLEAKARNLSLGGIFVETTANFSPGQEIQLAIPFFHQKQRITLTGTVVRVTDDGIGIRFATSAIGME